MTTNLNEELLLCKNILNDVDTLADAVFEHDLSTDEIVNILIGIKQLYKIRFSNIEEHLKKIHNDEITR